LSSILHTVLPYHLSFFLFFFNHPPTTEIYTLSLHDALPISSLRACRPASPTGSNCATSARRATRRPPSRPRARDSFARWPTSSGRDESDRPSGAADPRAAPHGRTAPRRSPVASDRPPQRTGTATRHQRLRTSP